MAIELKKAKQEKAGELAISEQLKQKLELVEAKFRAAEEECTKATTLVAKSKKMYKTW